MISLQNLTVRRGARTLIDDATLTIHPGQRVGVVGRNGTGKSTLFSLMLGEMAADGGNFTRPKNWAVATVAQETPALQVPALEFALDGDAELRLLEAKLSKAEADEDALLIGKLHDRLAMIDAYTAPARAAKLLDGLGFTHAMQSRNVADFSGGWRMRLNLARALLSRSDLMLLDEPTNHLDLDAVIWLQDWLAAYEGTLLMVSHDREFLDAVTTHTLHLHAEKLTIYSGNYSAFERLRAERLSQQASLRASQERQVAHLQKFVDRFKAQATKAKQAQSRVKMIERITLVASVVADSEFSFSFKAPPKIPSPLVRLNKASVGYNGVPQLTGMNLGIEPGDRIGLLGPNGAGKSTFIKLLVDELAIIGGECVKAPDTVIGYFAQHQLEHLDEAASPIMHFKRMAPNVREQDLRDYLGSFNFRGDRVFEAIAPFSGGEKARLALALVVYPRPNLLLLDEPTNHLDLDMRQALEMALHDFAGAVVLVSHDRHLVSSVCDRLWRVADGKVEAFDGDLDDYAKWLTSRSRADTPMPAKSPVQPKAEIRADQKEKLRNLRDIARKLEVQMAKLQDKLNVTETKLQDPGLYEKPGEELKRLTKLRSEQKAQLDLVEAEWLEAAGAIDAIENPAD